MTVLAAAGSGTLSPLPGAMRDGLVAITVIAFFSLIATSLLLTWIIYRTVRSEWAQLYPLRQPFAKAKNGGSNLTERPRTEHDLSLGLEERHFYQTKVKSRRSFRDAPRSRLPQRPPAATTESSLDGSWNPMIILILSLLFASLTQCLGPLLNIAWLVDNGVFVPSAACWAQGWFMQVGRMATSCHVVVISICTFLTIAKGYRLSKRAVAIPIACAWAFAIIIPSSGVIATNNGEDEGGYYVRNSISCWVSSSYSNRRIYHEDIWIFIALVLTSVFLVLVVLSSRWKRQFGTSWPARTLSDASSRESARTLGSSGQHPVLLIYQLIYIVCIFPYAICRMIELSGKEVGVPYQTVVCAINASYAFHNVILWSTTILLLGDKDSKSTGLQKFAFVRTPNRRYGNTIFIRGGSKRATLKAQDDNDNDNGEHRWWRGGSATAGPSIGPSRRHGKTQSQESLRKDDQSMLGESGIQMEIITSVVVEPWVQTPTTPHVPSSSSDKVTEYV
ncbi:hypothetical protein BX600DRAFT_518510 [Xylariales sp. PMI_506]|nr:hypothetical protein BX600DRAFT_518510 [Xylariales sp. PMI_506]